MASGSVTSTGLSEMRKAVEQLPAEVTAALKEVARQTAQRELQTARTRLRAQQKTVAHALADLIEVIDDSEHQQFKVISTPPGDQPANVTIWNERGTRFMAARPYMRPANDGEIDRYRHEMEAASAASAQKVFGT